MNFINKRTFNYKLLGRSRNEGGRGGGDGAIDDAEQNSDNERLVHYYEVYRSRKRLCTLHCALCLEWAPASYALFNSWLASVFCVSQMSAYVDLLWKTQVSPVSIVICDVYEYQAAVRELASNMFHSALEQWTRWFVWPIKVTCQSNTTLAYQGCVMHSSIVWNVRIAFRCECNFFCFGNTRSQLICKLSHLVGERQQCVSAIRIKFSVLYASF